MRYVKTILALVLVPSLVPASACDGVATQASLGYTAPLTASYAATTYAAPTIQSAYILSVLPVTTGVATTAIVQPQVQVQAAQQVVQAETYASPPTLAAATYAAAPVTVLAATPSVNYASPLLFAGNSYGYSGSFGNLASLGYSNRAFFGATNSYGFNRGFSSLGYGGFNRGLAFHRNNLAFVNQAAVPIVQQRRVGGIFPGVGRALFGRKVVGAAVVPQAAFVAPRAFVGRGAFIGGRRGFVGGRRFR